MTAIEQGYYYARAKSGYLDKLREEVCNYGNNPRRAEMWLHGLTNPVEDYTTNERGNVMRRITWRVPLLAYFTAPRYLRSPEAAIKLAMKVSEKTPEPLGTNEVARAALAKVAKGDTIFWGLRASEHIAHAIINEMLNRMEAMRGY